MKKSTIQAFMDELASSAPTPGGGAVAGLTGALSAALSSMVSSLAVESSKYESSKEVNLETQRESRHLIDECFDLMNGDAKAFDELMASFKLPKGTEEEKAVRKSKILMATKNAIIAPMQTVRICARLAELAYQAADRGNRGAITDAAIAADLAITTAKAASYNVMINLKSLKDEGYAKKCVDEISKIMHIAEHYRDKVEELTRKELG